MYAKDFLDNMKSTSKKTSNQVLTEKTRAASVGSLIGGGVGIMIAYQRDKSLIMGAFIGALVGALASTIFIDKQFSNK